MGLRILFVCLGNICRSPAAEAVFRTKCQQAGIEFCGFESAGTGDWHRGEPPDRRTIVTGTCRGYSLEGKQARQVTQDDFSAFDVIFAMDRRNCRDLLAICPANHSHKVVLLLENVSGTTDEVPDPYYGTLADFEQMYDLLECAAEHHLRRWERGGP